MFYNGLAANNSPIRVLATTGGLVAGQRIASGGASTIVTAGLYSFIRAVPARFSTNSTLVANASTLDAIYRLTPSGSTTEPQVMPTREGPVLNVPQPEWSSLPNVGTGAKVAVVGDWKSNYVRGLRGNEHRARAPLARVKQVTFSIPRVIRVVEGRRFRARGKRAPLHGSRRIYMEVAAS
jgi:HK97 family phage major capsid protein